VTSSAVGSKQFASAFYCCRIFLGTRDRRCCGIAARGAADWLGLAAAPTFAGMALLTGVFGGGQPDLFCSALHGASSLSGMVPMYLLMSAFHTAPWLRLIARR